MPIHTKSRCRLERTKSTCAIVDVSPYRYGQDLGITVGAMQPHHSIGIRMDPRSFCVLHW